MSSGSPDIAPRDVLNFWFKAGPEKWFKSDPDFDAEIAAKFSDAVAAAADGWLDDWRDSAEGALALVILLDQFPRNIHRGKAEAFASDAKAMAVADHAIARRFDTEVPAAARRWFYMPFMHSEALADQRRCVELFETRLPDDAESIKFAKLHLDLIERFGRFPHRNAILGRISTAPEQDYLSQPDAFTG